MDLTEYGAATEAHINSIIAGITPIPTDWRTLARVQAGATWDERCELRGLLNKALPQADADRVWVEAAKASPLYLP